MPPAREDDQPGMWAEFTVSELGGADAPALGELPLTLEVDGVLFCHATPRSDEEMVTRLSVARAMGGGCSRAASQAASRSPPR